MLNDFLSKSYEPASSSDATSLVDELYRQIMYDAFSRLSGKVLARRLHTLYTFLCTAERTSASIVATLICYARRKNVRAKARGIENNLKNTQILPASLRAYDVEEAGKAQRNYEDVYNVFFITIILFSLLPSISA